MKKKQLNRRQLWRIQKMQSEYAARAQKKQHQTEDQVDSSSLGAEQKGLVIAHFGQQLDIEALEGEHQGQIFRCHQRSNLEPLVAGDNVIWQQGEPLSVVVANLPRSSVLKRPNNYGDIRPVAANIDNIIIVIAPLPHPHSNLIDRYIVAAENIGIQPILLLNKSDLITAENQAELVSLLSIYKDIGYTTLTVSSKNNSGMPELKALLDQQTSIFVGQSGVGKSALVNNLLPEVNILEGALSEFHEQGRHTTTTARVFHFPDGGDLIDSPGIREFGLWHISPEELVNGFKEFRPFLGYCKFRDCKHLQEPNCRLIQAIEEGDINPKRMDNYQQILESLD